MTKRWFRGAALLLAAFILVNPLALADETVDETSQTPAVEESRVDEHTQPTAESVSVAEPEPEKAAPQTDEAAPAACGDIPVADETGSLAVPDDETHADPAENDEPAQEIAAAETEPRDEDTTDAAGCDETTEESVDPETIQILTQTEVIDDAAKDAEDPDEETTPEETRVELVLGRMARLSLDAEADKVVAWLPLSRTMTVNVKAEGIPVRVTLNRAGGEEKEELEFKQDGAQWLPIEANVDLRRGEYIVTVERIQPNSSGTVWLTISEAAQDAPEKINEPADAEKTTAEPETIPNDPALSEAEEQETAAEAPSDDVVSEEKEDAFADELLADDAESEQAEEVQLSDEALPREEPAEETLPDDESSEETEEQPQADELPEAADELPVTADEEQPPADFLPDSASSEDDEQAPATEDFAEETIPGEDVSADEELIEIEDYDTPLGLAPRETAVTVTATFLDRSCTEVMLSVEVSGCDSDLISIEWQYSPDGGETVCSVPDAHDDCYVYTLDDANRNYLWRAVVICGAAEEKAE